MLLMTKVFKLLAQFLILSIVSFQIVVCSINTHLRVVAAKQPPFVFRRLDGSWTGIEVRFLEILSGPLNFTFNVAAPSGKVLIAKTSSWASSDHGVVVEVASGAADLGIGGVHVVPGSTEEGSEVRAVYPHSDDCAVFLTQSSIALPRHRAIMGPFHWKVWLSLTIAYLFAAGPLAILSTAIDRGIDLSAIKIPLRERSAFSALVHLIWSMIKTIHESFWDVFGTFTNAFTMEKGWRSIGFRKEEKDDENESDYTSTPSQSSSATTRKRSSTVRSWRSSLGDRFMAALVGKEGLRLLVAFYWAFTVIVSALYTGSIIAFITLPVYPKPYNTGEELMHAGFTWGTLAAGDWSKWLRESDGPVGEQVRKLTARAEAYGCGCRGMRLFRSAEKGIKAVESSSSLAFLSSRSLITYLIAHPASGEDEEEEDDEESSLFSFNLLRKVVGKKRKGPVMAISSECFLPFRIGFLVRGDAEGKRISEELQRGLLIAEQAGLLKKGRVDADLEVGIGEEEEVDVQGKVVSSSEKRWRAMHGNRLIFGGGFRLGHGVLTERVLGLDDMQLITFMNAIRTFLMAMASLGEYGSHRGIFLLLGAGFAIAFFALFVEIIVMKTSQRCCVKDTEIDDEIGLEAGFSDGEVKILNVEEYWDSIGLKKETFHGNEDKEWTTYSDTYEIPRRTSAPAADENIYQREFLKGSPKPRRVNSSYSA